MTFYLTTKRRSFKNHLPGFNNSSVDFQTYNA